MIFNITSLAGAMGLLDKRLAKLKISRSATKYFPGMSDTETVNNYFAGRTKTMDVQTLLNLLHGAGMQLWVTELPKTAAERRRWEEKFAKFMTDAGIQLEPDSEVQVPQEPAPGQVLRRATRGIVGVHKAIVDI